MQTLDILGLRREWCMTSIRNHLALIIPLIALLFGIESIMLVNRAISTHEMQLAQNYQIIIASKETLDLNKIQTFVREAVELKSISPAYIINELKTELPKDAIETLQKELPFFYSLRLDSYPSDERIDKISSTLSRLGSVTRVESFKKTHSQVYKLLLIIKGSVIIFSVLSAILSCLLMVKQIEVWKLEHSERMQIMSFLGAPSWMRNNILLKLAVIDSIIATIAIVSALVYFKTTPLAGDVAIALEVDLDIIKTASDCVILFFSSVIISLVSVFFVIIKQKDF